MMKNVYRMVLSMTGAAIALGFALWLVLPPESPFLVASIGGSTIFLFGLTRAPAAQPRALFGGHLGGAAIGILCYQTLGDSLWTYVISCVLTLAFMLTAKMMHPPAGATPLIMVQAHASWPALVHPLGLSVLVLALIAFLWTHLVPKMVRYPAKWWDKSPSTIWWGNWEG